MVLAVKERHAVGGNGMRDEAARPRLLLMSSMRCPVTHRYGSQVWTVATLGRYVIEGSEACISGRWG